MGRFNRLARETLLSQLSSRVSHIAMPSILGITKSLRVESCWFRIIISVRCHCAVSNYTWFLGIIADRSEKLPIRYLCDPVFLPRYNPERETPLFHHWI